MSARRTRRPLRFPLRLQLLEGRIAPATFTVINNHNSGSGSLRQAVLNANSASGTDLIDFSSYFNVPRTITLTSQISITGAVTIDGTSAANVTISGNDAVRIFNTQAAPAGTSVSLVDLTLKSGFAGQSYGGAVYAGDEALSATRCLFTANVAENGGAIGVDGGGSLTATDCVFTANMVSIEGGAIFSSNPTILSRCEFSSNSAHNGGGLSIHGNLLLEASTISGNTAFAYGGYYSYEPGSGGGIYVAGNTATIRNCTISGNIAGDGGGIASPYGNLAVQNSTITGNAATWAVGGGIWGGTISLESSIVANNVASFGGNGGPDINASTVNTRNSLIFDRGGIAVFNDLGGNRAAGENPRLGTLQNNGGPTKTHVLLPGSPCADAGSNPANLTADQRGPGFPRVLNGFADMGAAEGMDPIPTATTISLPPTITVAGGSTFTVVVRYNDDIGINLATIDLGDIIVTGPGYTAPQSPNARSISGSGQLVTITYTFPAPGGVFDFSDYGDYAIAVAANQVGDADTPVHHFVVPVPLGWFRVSIPGTLVVDEVSDIDDGNTSTGHLSLREALRLTNAAAGTSDTIRFNPAVFGSPRTITMTAGQFTVTDTLTIIGPGSGLLTLNAAGASRHFLENEPGADNLVSLSGLTLINGLATDGGGAIFNINGGLTLSDLVINNCQANNAGGAIFAFGPLTMRDCTVSNNRETSSGGGIYVANGPVLIERCSIVNNQAGGAGGGLYISINGLLQISECTISGNQSQSSGSVGGGGILFTGSPTSGSFIRNSTISGNVAGGSTGGGLYLFIDGTLPIANSTITGNSTTGPGGGIAVIDGYYNSGNVSLNSTIIAGNSAGSGADLYFNSDPIAVTGDNNLVGVADPGNFTLTGTGNRTGTIAAPLDARLGPLANNGGPTKTHALLPGSPAINAGNNVANLPNDQRGVGFSRVAGVAADIGAFEIQSAPPTAVARINDGSAQRSRVTSLTVTFSAQVTFAGAVGNAFTLVRTGGGSVNLSATANVVGGVTVVTLNGFTGGETQFGSLRDGRYTLTALASQISAGGLILDGDGDGQPGGNLTFGDAQGLFRFFGDSNGDRHVDIADFGLFSSSIFNPATYIAAFDFNNDGVIDIADFGQFAIRMFTPQP